MEMNDYQVKAFDTANYPQETKKDSLAYVTIGLVGEAGEIANKFKKYLRGDFELTDKIKEEFVSELGDCLWYIAEYARQLGFDLSYVGKKNIEKLAERKSLGTIQGNGEGNRVLKAHRGSSKSYKQAKEIEELFPQTIVINSSNVKLIFNNSVINTEIPESQLVFDPQTSIEKVIQIELPFKTCQNCLHESTHCDDDPCRRCCDGDDKWEPKL